MSRCPCLFSETICLSDLETRSPRPQGGQRCWEGEAVLWGDKRIAASVSKKVRDNDLYISTSDTDEEKGIERRIMRQLEELNGA